MILRTPPPKRPRPDATTTDHHHEQALVIYEDLPSGPLIESSPHHHHQTPDSSSSSHMLCTYQCRQMVKSEFIEALSTAEKKVCDYEAKLEVLNNNFSTSESERKKFKDKLLYVEQQLAAAQGRERALQEQLLKEINAWQERLKKQLETNSALEVKLENERNLRRKAESSATSAEEKASVLEGKLNHLSESIEREKKRLGNELTESKKESKLSVSRIGADLERMECRARTAEKESELLTEQLEDMKVKLSECLHKKTELEKKVSRVQFQEVSSSESDVLVKHLQEELRNYESEVREARKLRSSHENVELLKEKLLEEKGRRERAESQLPKLLEFELREKVLEDELSSWKMLLNEIPGVTSCDHIPIKFAALQKEVIDNMMKLGDASAHLKQIEVALDAAQLSKEKAETEAAMSKEKAEGLELEVKQIGQMLSSVTEERDRLKSAVAELKRSMNDQAGDDLHSGILIKDLESALAKKESYIEHLENNLNVQKEINKRQLDDITSLNEKLNNEAKKIKSLERESDRLRSEISLLESKLGHGDFSAANTKVLRMVNTLAVDDEAKQTIETLQMELQKMKEKLQALEELKSHSGDAGKLVDSYISGKITQLKDQIATLEKREERYKTVFADRISVFRRACCELFGYKIVMDDHQRLNGIPVTRFTLQSIYAQSDDEKLEFDYESGNTNIMENDYTSQPEIARQVDIFIRKMNSIPAFTANLTVESFNRRTLS